MEVTPNGMEYEWFHSTEGVTRSILHAIIDTHKESDVHYSIKWIKQNVKFIESIQVRWKRKEEISGLMRIPNSVIIKNLNIEIGKLNAYITELEEKIRTYDSMTPEERKTVLKENILHEQEIKIKEQEKLIARLRKESEQLIIKLNTKG